MRRRDDRQLRARRSMKTVGVLAALAALALLPGCHPPELSVRTVVSGADIPWGLDFTPDGDLLYTERSGEIRILDGGTDRQILEKPRNLWVSGETGLMDLAVDPAFADNRRLYTCQGFRSGGYTDVRVVVWLLNTPKTKMYRVGPVLAGFPTSSGRHGGCRIEFGRNGALLAGTGDAAIGTTPQNINSYGGKILRVNRFSGQGLDSNPFADSPNGVARRVWSWGHRNTQGMAARPADGGIWTVEHGPDRDDEINRGYPGNFGWNPVPGYNESVPMTDTAEFPNARRAAWASGSPTIATSGADWLAGEEWGAWDDTLAVASLKDSSLRIFGINGSNSVEEVAEPIDGEYGRLRTPVLGPDGKLYVSTSNGGGQDKILEITATHD